MAETLRSVRVKVILDTNKRTVVLDEECEDLEDATRKVEAFQEKWEDL